MRRQGAWAELEFRAHQASADTRLEVAGQLRAVAGMRVGEILALRWTDIDLDNCRINVQHAVVGVPHAALAVPPARPGARTITASRDLLEALRRHRQRQGAERSEWGESYGDAGLVICREDGRPLHPRALHAALRQGLTAAGPPAISVAGQHRSGRGPALLAGIGP